MKKNQPFVVQCIKGNNNRCGLGYRYKAGQYVTYFGKPTNNINEAHVYHNNCDQSCALDNNYESYFKYVPVVIRKLTVTTTIEIDP